MIPVRAVTSWRYDSRVAILLAAVLSLVLLPSPGASGRPRTRGGQITDLGEPVLKTQALSSAIGTGPDGEPQAYLLLEGNPTTPAEFAVVDLRTRATVLDQRIPRGASSSRAMGVSPVDGAVYFGTSDTGDLYRYRPGTTTVEHLGEAPDNEQVWDLTVGTDGTVWFGTYPGGRLFSLDPGTGAVRDFGQAVAGETYVNAIAQAGNDLYVGTEPNAKLTRMDLATGAFTEVAMPPGHAASNIDKLDVRRGLLFVTSNGTAYVRDLSTDAWTAEIDGVGSRGVSPVDPDTGDTVYYWTSPGTVVRYDLDTLTSTTTQWAPHSAPESWAFVDLADPGAPGRSLAFTSYNHGRIYAYDYADRATYYLEPRITGAADQLMTLGTGPDGAVYAGAYLTPPGMARWDPDAGAFTLLEGSGQVEGYGTYAGDLVFGRYPQGALYRYDLDQPWAPGTNPGPPVTIGNEQNRPQSFARFGDEMAVSSVPITGRHGGAVSLWNPDTGALAVYRNVVPDQTPVSLLHHGRLLYGGTSINGGYGIDPVTTEGHLFAWDPAAHRTVFRLVPVPGAANVSGLVADERGLIWGLGDSTLFAFDPASCRVVRQVRLFPEPDDSRFGHDRVLVLEHGELYGVTGNRFFAFDRATGTTTVLYDGPANSGGVPAAANVRNLTRDRDGDLYFVVASTHVYRYRSTQSPQRERGAPGGAAW